MVANKVLGWPKVPLVFCNILWKNTNELFGQPNEMGEKSGENRTRKDREN